MNKSICDDEFDELICQSLLRSGAVFPMSAWEAKQVKAKLAKSQHALPAHLAEAAQFWKGLTSKKADPVGNIIAMPLGEFAEVKEELTRAARNGKEAISAEVEQKLRANRLKAKSINETGSQA